MKLKVHWKVWLTLSIYMLLFSLVGNLLQNRVDETTHLLLLILVKIIIPVGFLIGFFYLLYKLPRLRPEWFPILESNHHLRTSMTIGLIVYQMVISSWGYDVLKGFVQPLRYKVLIDLVSFLIPLLLLQLFFLVGEKYFPTYLLIRKDDSTMNNRI